MARTSALAPAARCGEPNPYPHGKGNQKGSGGRDFGGADGAPLELDFVLANHAALRQKRQHNNCFDENAEVGLGRNKDLDDRGRQERASCDQVCWKKNPKSPAPATGGTNARNACFRGIIPAATRNASKATTSTSNAAPHFRTNLPRLTRALSKTASGISFAVAMSLQFSIQPDILTRARS